LSLVVSAHALEQHVGEPEPHALKHDPQFSSSLAVSAQYGVPPSGEQSVVVVHELAHEPLEHTCAPLQTLPHDPQFDSSVLVFAQ
jgi:hypothetical protein